MDGDTVVLLLGILVVLLVLLKLFRHVQTSRRNGSKSIAIVVLGDIGRSPRMLYHATSFAERGFRTYIVAYSGAFMGGPSSGFSLIKRANYRHSTAGSIAQITSCDFRVLVDSTPFRQQVTETSLLATIAYQSTRRCSKSVLGSRVQT